MSKRKKQTKKIVSSVMLSAMLLNTALPYSSTMVHAAEIQSQQTPSSGSFTADEVNRILAGLTPEQKANINKLTGADITQKIHVDQKDLRKTSNVEVIVQFKTDPAKIQIIKQSLEQGGATVSAQAFASELGAAQQKVKNAHTAFKSFVNTQAKTQIIGGEEVKTKMSITREYTDAFNGVALTLPGNQVEELAKNAEVASVWPVVEYTTSESGTPSQTAELGSLGKPTTGLTLLGLDKLQAEGHTGIIKEGPRAGQKVKVGVLDTGIDYNHPDLYEVTHDANGNLYGGHDFVNSIVDAQGNIKFIDDLDPMETIYPDWVKQKAEQNPAYAPAGADYKSYITAHGTHVSGTIAANTTNNNDIYSANGVAPDVELHGYRVLGPSGSGSSESVIGGIDQSVKDQMDVINLSLGNTTNDPFYPTSIAINNATLAGVVCSISAGNSGPGIATVGSPGTSPLAITVGASSIPAEIPVMTIQNGNTSYPARLFGKSFADADDALKGQTLPIVDVGAGRAVDYEGKDVKDKVVLVQRGGEFMQTKIVTAHDAGAKAMIIWDNQDDTETQGYIPSYLGVKQDHVYSISLTQAQGQALRNAIKVDPDTASVTFPEHLDAPVLKKGDELANFSSTGPVRDWTIKPDVVAPGVDILSTVPYDIWTPQEGVNPHDYQYSYEAMSGTSMAAPHTTGVIALVLAAHPEYTPADVKAVLMNTAKDINTDSKTYSVYQVGAGRIDPKRAIQSDVKIQVLDKARTVESGVLAQVDHLTGNMFFGFKGRGDGATNGSDDVVSSKEFQVVNQGVSSKTFKVSTEFLSTKFAQSNKVGSETGNDVSVDFTNGGEKVTNIQVDGNSTTKSTATITVPSNALDGAYEGYIHLVNTADASETYRIPFTIVVAEKGIDSFKVAIKATKVGGISAYTFSVNNEMDNFYLVLKDKDGKYIGLANTLNSASDISPGVQYGPYLTLFNGWYFPFTKDYDGTYDASGISNELTVLQEGAYSLEMIATDKVGKHYKAEDTVYVDGQAPTMTMDDDSKGGIYEIDPTGYLPGQEIKGFYGTVYDSNIDVMKNNAETSVLSPRDGVTPVPVDQGLNTVVGYQDSYYPTVIFNTDAKGRFHFGVAPEDVTNRFGSEFIINPVDYAGNDDYDTKQQTYYFIKKGTPYLTLTSSEGVDAGPGNEDKVVIDANIPFKTTIATKYGTGMTGAKIILNDSKVYQYSNIRLTDDYKDYLVSKGINLSDVVLTVSDPYVHPVYQSGKSIDVTIKGIDAAGALDHDMDIIEADVTYTSLDPITGPHEMKIVQVNVTLSGKDTLVTWFPTNVPYVRQSSSLLRGRVAAESFSSNNINNNYPQFTVESGAKVTVIDDKGKKFTTDNPTNANNTIKYAFIDPYYAVTMDVSDNPYSVEASVPGHFKGYGQTPVIGLNKFGYQSGTVKDLPGLFPILLGGDVNGDNVIDMNDLLAEVNALTDYKAQVGTIAKKAWLNNPTNRNYDIYWIPTGNPGGWGIDYNDFYFIFKNFGKVNQNAIDANVPVGEPQLTLTSDTMVNGVNVKAGAGVEEVRAALQFAGPIHTTVTTIPKLQDLQNGATISLTPASNVFVDDVMWRERITSVMVGSTDVTNDVTIAPAYMYNDALGQRQTMPSKITFPGSLFPSAANYTVTIKATGYQDVTKVFTVSTVAIPTPTIPVVTDPEKAHIGKDLTFTFTEDQNWREGIHTVKVKTLNSALIDITDLKDGNGEKYYDISVPGQITFKADLFKTNVTNMSYPSFATAAITPGGVNWLPQLYQFDISSTGKQDGTIYPVKSISEQAIGYGVTFDTQGGTPVSPVAVGYQPAKTRINGAFIANGAYIGGNKNPSTTRPGYVFIGWFNQAGTSQWDPGNNVAADQTVYAKWQMNATQNYSPVDTSDPNGFKFDLSNGEVTGIGKVLGEGDLEITIPDYLTNVSWLTDKAKIAKIEAAFYAINSDSSTSTSETKYTLDPSTYDLNPGANQSGVLSFTTATHDQAVEAGQTQLGEKFAFSEMPSLSNLGNIKGYKLTLTATTGETVTIPDIKLGYRRHIDLNGGTLKDANSLFLADQLINGKVTAPTMSRLPLYVTKDNLTPGPYLYLDASGASDKKSDITDTTKIIVPTDNTTYYLGWINVPPAVSKDTVGNIVGSDITLTFQDDGVWKNNIQAVKIGAKTLVADTVKDNEPVINDYNITYDSITKKGVITLHKSLFTIGQKVNVTIVSEGYQDVVVIDQIIGYTVTFESNGGEAVPAQIVDRSATKPVNPILVGYKFYGWYSDADFSTLYDFSNIVTKPITLYAKYALAGSTVLPDTTDNALGNDMALEFGDREWARAITHITINGLAVDPTKYHVDTVTHTLTLDKSLFTRARDYAILIKATDYSDVSLVQKAVNGYHVNFELQDAAPFEVEGKIVVKRITEPVVYGYDLTWFADADYQLPWSFTSSIYADRTLYGKWTPHKFSVVFDHQDGSLVDHQTANYLTTITAPTTPTRAGHTFLGWYKDAMGQTAWNFATDKVEGDTILYAKWATDVPPTPIDTTPPVVTGVSNNGLYNHDVVVGFNEGTATLNGEAITSGIGVSKEGTYSLIVTDQAGNVTTVTFTIDKTAPIVTGLANNGQYKNAVTATFNEATATLNGKVITSGTVVNTEGAYTLIVTDQAGNVTTVKFTIDKTAPIVTGVSNNGLYNKVVFIKFNEGTATLNGKSFRSGTFVKLNGAYTLLVKDAAGNIKIVKFTIDKTPPLAPKVNKVTSMTTKVTGKAEAGSTVVIKVGTKVIGTAKADKYGKFTVSIKKQKIGRILYVSAKDKAGNVSKATKVTVRK
jgi:uncharacterized repeat protein (TIGR02543 family)